MKEINYKIDGLDCASCAASIESSATNIKDVNNVTIDLMTNNVKVSVENIANIDKVFSELNILADKIEPGAKLYSKDNDFEIEEVNNNTLIRIIASTVLLLIGLVMKNDTYNFIFLMASYIIIGYDILILAVKNLFRGRALDENFLMGIATIGALFINERFEAVLVMLLYQIGEYLQDLAVDQSKRSIANLMDIKPDFAIKVVDGKEIKVDPDDVKVGDIIIIRAGEKVPLDGVVVSGYSSIDAKALTGESLPINVSESSDVLSGSINIDGVIEVEVTKAYFESTVKQILDLVENASSNKAESEKFISRFAKYYTPVVVALAFTLAFIVPLVTTGKLYDYSYIYKALTFLVISCPCALVISVPLSFFGGIGGASKAGILFKGSNYVEMLSKVDNVLFDKTGTLTEGNFAVSDVITDKDRDDVIMYAAFAEYYSNHPIGKSIVDVYGKEIDQNLLSGAEELANYGVGVVYDNKQIWAGNYKLMELKTIDASEHDSDKSIVYVAVDGEFYGVIIVEDEIKASSYDAIKALRDLGISNVEMLTGDNEKIAQEVAKELNLTNAYAGLKPVDKVNIVENYMNQDKVVAFVGDGINDAPVLTMADIGVAMGALGSDAAIEAADIVIMDDNPYKLSVAIKHSKKTMKIVTQNIVFALSIKFLFLILGALGISSMAMAVFADVGVSLIAILNSIRLLRIDQ